MAVLRIFWPDNLVYGILPAPGHLIGWSQDNTSARAITDVVVAGVVEALSKRNFKTPLPLLRLFFEVFELQQSLLSRASTYIL